MPVPIIELQRRLTLVGAIRAGAERPSDGRRPGQRLHAFRLTSPRRELIEQACQLYGGAVSEWKSPVGEEWQVYTEAPELPVLVMPGYSLKQRYELWEGATKRTRLCDGDGHTEEISGRPCLCESEGETRCDLYTRLVVALPELDTVLGWRLITRGANAAHELPTMMALVEGFGLSGSFVPARLRIDERRGVKDGQVVRYVVPSLDLGVGYLAFASAGPRGLPPPGNGDLVGAPAFALESGVAAINEPRTGPRETGGKRPAFGQVAPPPPAEPPPIPAWEAPTLEATALAPTELIPVGTEHAGLPANEQAILDDLRDELDAEEIVGDPQTAKASGPQKKKLDILVAKLYDARRIRKPVLWRAVATMRDVDPYKLVDDLKGRVDPSDQTSDMRWSPLRDDLSRVEANQLIDRLEKLEATIDQGGPS